MTAGEEGTVDAVQDLAEALESLEHLIDEDPRPEHTDASLELADRARSAGEDDLEVRALLCVDRAVSALDLEPGGAAEALERAIAVEGCSPGLRGLANFELGVWLERSDPRRAMDLHSEAEELFLAAAAPDRAAQSLLRRGELEGSGGDRESALESFETARQHARSGRAPRLAAVADDRIAAAHWELGRLDLAERHLRAALSVYDAMDDARATAWARYRLGWCIANDVRTNDRANEALDLLGAARQVARSDNDVNLVADCDHQAAAIFEDRDDHDRAVSLYRAALAVYDAAGDDARMQIARVNLAMALFEIGFHHEAEHLLKRVVSEGEEGNAHTPRVGAASRLARHLVMTQRAEEALDVLDQVADEVDHDNRSEAAKYLLARAAAFDALNMTAGTREAALGALDRLDRTRLPSLHGEALEFLGRSATREGEQEQADAWFGQAVALYLADGNDEKARDLASEIVPPPPKREETEPEVQAFTGQYL